jgi:hypothetical protein
MPVFDSSLATEHVLERMGTRVILSPSVGAADADHDNAREPYVQLWRNSYTDFGRLYGLFFDAILWSDRTSARWRELPKLLAVWNNA